MPIVTVAPITRKGMRLLISLYGMSETGKTYSALKLMAGIEPDPSKRGLLDTEGGERGRAYMDAIEGGYMYGSLTPPFTPERYTEALYDFIDAGVTTLCVDSVSHAWFAAGGVLDMVEQATEKDNRGKWAKPKRRLGKLTGHWMHCGLQLILCARGKQPLLEEVIDGKKKYLYGDVVPIQEKSLRFDMTIMGLMLGDGRFSVARKDGGKCPGALRAIFESGDLMDEAMGRKLISWIGGLDESTPEQRRIAMEAGEIAGEGVAKYEAFWKGLTKEQRLYLLPKHENLKSIAKAADAGVDDQKKEAAEEEKRADLDDPFGDRAAVPDGVTLVGGIENDPAPGDRP